MSCYRYAILEKALEGDAMCALRCAHLCAGGLGALCKVICMGVVLSNKHKASKAGSTAGHEQGVVFAVARDCSVVGASSGVDLLCCVPVARPTYLSDMHLVMHLSPQESPMEKFAPGILLVSVSLSLWALQD